MSNAIEFHNVWKKFKKGEKLNSLRDSIPRLFKNKIAGDNPLSDMEFWAVKDVSFEVEKGDVIGIMGPNGAGKSTILKLLSRIMLPSKGEMKINGRLSALIEVTAGFHPELTGRENVYLNGTILGMRSREINDKFDEIIEFSGVSEFIDTPVKRYSSGMYSRLGFSVAAHMDPDILLVDEVLSVGDSAFQAKCAEKMRELMKKGATIVIVSHSLSLIQSLCKRAILLNHGEVVKNAPTDEVIPFYENIVIGERENEINKKTAVLAGNQVRVASEPLLDITEVSIKNAAGKSGGAFDQDDEIVLTINYFAKKVIEKPVFWVDINRTDGILCCSAATLEDNFVIDEIEGKGSITVNLGKLRLAPNIYLIKVSICDRELIHSYAVRYQDTLKINVNKARITGDVIFIPQAKWGKP